VDPHIFAAQHVDQFVADNFNDLLAWTQTLEHILADGPGSHSIRELLDDFEIHIGFEQCDADFLQGIVNVLLREAAFALQVLECAL
jgi:hypothetical protein